MDTQNVILLFICDMPVQRVTSIEHLGCSECYSRVHLTCMCRELQVFSTLDVQIAILVFIVDMDVMTVTRICIPFPYHFLTISLPRATCPELTARCEGSRFGVAAVCIPFPYQLLTMSLPFPYQVLHAQN